MSSPFKISEGKFSFGPNTLQPTQSRSARKIYRSPRKTVNRTITSRHFARPPTMSSSSFQGTLQAMPGLEICGQLKLCSCLNVAWIDFSPSQSAVVLPASTFSVKSASCLSHSHHPLASSFHPLPAILGFHRTTAHNHQSDITRRPISFFLVIRQLRCRRSTKGSCSLSVAVVNRSIQVNHHEHTSSNFMI